MTQGQISPPKCQSYIFWGVFLVPPTDMTSHVSSHKVKKQSFITLTGPLCMLEKGQDVTFVGRGGLEQCQGLCNDSKFR